MESSVGAARGGTYSAASLPSVLGGRPLTPWSWAMLCPMWLFPALSLPLSLALCTLRIPSLSLAVLRGAVVCWTDVVAPGLATPLVVRAASLRWCRAPALLHAAVPLSLPRARGSCCARRPRRPCALCCLRVPSSGAGSSVSPPESAPSVSLRAGRHPAAGLAASLSLVSVVSVSSASSIRVPLLGGWGRVLSAAWAMRSRRRSSVRSVRGGRSMNVVRAMGSA